MNDRLWSGTLFFLLLRKPKLKQGTSFFCDRCVSVTLAKVTLWFQVCAGKSDVDVCFARVRGLLTLCLLRLDVFQSPGSITKDQADIKQL